MKDGSVSPEGFNKCPVEIIHHIAGYLDIKSRMALQSTCRKLNGALRCLPTKLRSLEVRGAVPTKWFIVDIHGIYIDGSTYHWRREFSCDYTSTTDVKSYYTRSKQQQQVEERDSFRIRNIQPFNLVCQHVKHLLTYCSIDNFLNGIEGLMERVYPNLHKVNTMTSWNSIYLEKALEKSRPKELNIILHDRKVNKELKDLVKPFMKAFTIVDTIRYQLNMEDVIDMCRHLEKLHVDLAQYFDVSLYITLLELWRHDELTICWLLIRGEQQKKQREEDRKDMELGGFPWLHDATEDTKQLENMVNYVSDRFDDSFNVQYFNVDHVVAHRKALLALHPHGLMFIEISSSSKYISCLDRSWR